MEEKRTTAVQQSCSRYSLHWGNHQQLSSAVSLTVLKHKGEHSGHVLLQSQNKARDQTHKNQNESNVCLHLDQLSRPYCTRSMSLSSYFESTTLLQQDLQGQHRLLVCVRQCQSQHSSFSANKRGFCREMANNFHMTEEVKSFHTTQTLPFIFTQKMCCEEQNTFEKTTTRTNRKDLF